MIILNEARTSFGYMGDMGNLPTNLEDLWVKNAQADFSFDTTTKTGAGWNGPYLETEVVEMLAALGQDAWGRDLSYDATSFTDSDFGADALGKLSSYGPDGLEGNGDDIALNFFTSGTESRVQGFVRDDDKNGISGVGVTMNYPSFGVTSSATLQTDSLGFYAFNDVPFGNRSITIEPKLVLAPDTAITTGNDNDTVELTVKNFAADDTDITSVTISWSTGNAAYFSRLVVGNTQMYNSTTPRLASGDNTSWTPAETVTGTGAVAQSVPIGIQSAITDVADLVIGDIGRGSSLDIEMGSFSDNASGGGGNAVDMVGVIFTLTFSDGSIVVAQPVDP